MRFKWTFDSLKKEALKYKTKGEFKKFHRAAYNASSKRDDHDLICEHMPKYLNRNGKESPRVEWTAEKLQKLALKYLERMEFVRCDRKAYFAAQRRGKKFLNAICSHMKPSQTEAYTDEELRLDVVQYLTRGDFTKLSPNVYKAAHCRGKEFLDNICSHMPKRVLRIGKLNHKFKWSLEKLLELAGKYSRRSELSENYPAAVRAAKKMDQYDVICSHMRPSSGSSIAERELLAVIKVICPSARKLRDMKVNIFNKPYIKGFEIDIFVPELNKGIEFDGKYHHSFECMRKDPKRSKWSDEDIANYHKLKDEYFLTKNIEILHIKECDWNLNKEVCIQKCLNFLQL